MTAGAQERLPEGAQLEELRSRWAQKSAEERRILRRRFEELKAMGPEERLRLLERVRRLRALESRLGQGDAEPQDPREHGPRAGAPPPFGGPGPAPGVVPFPRCREFGRSLREVLSPEMRRRLEEAPPGERWRVLEHLRRREREHHSRNALRALGWRLGLPAEEVRRYEALPLPERLGVVLQLERRRIETLVAERGLPPGLDEAMWARLESLPDEEFLRRARVLFPFEPGGPPGLRGPRGRWERPPGPPPFGPGRGGRRPDRHPRR
jgi:hypothetical protein